MRQQQFEKRALLQNAALSIFHLHVKVIGEIENAES